MAEHHDTTEPQGHDHHDHGEVDCEAALAEIYTYLDGELTEEKRQLIAGHLEGCSPWVADPVHEWLAGPWSGSRRYGYRIAGADLASLEVTRE